MKTLITALACAACLCAQAPDYTAAGIVNGANFMTGPVAPNDVVSLFGTTLSWNTTPLALENIIGNTMPEMLGGVEVFVAGYPAHLYYVSPKQVNLLIPNFLRPGTWPMWLTRDGMTGPSVQVTLVTAAPALFLAAPNVALATHLDYSLVTADSPAKADEIIFLWAAGLGCLQGDLNDGELASGAAWLCDMNQFSISVGGEPLDPSLILYAGVAPGYAGLYQVNMRMPAKFPPNPEIRLGVGDAVSVGGVSLNAK